MSRWEPDARGRMLRSALDLFSMQGYDLTTTAQIAENAGLTKTTFFRHFTEKREVLFFGQAHLIELAVAGIDAAPDSASDLAAVVVGLDAMAAAHRDEQRDCGLQLRSVIAANIELRERAAFKRASIAAGMARALHDRGTQEPVAGLAAEVGARAYHLGYDRWIEPTNNQQLSSLIHDAVTELRAALSTLA